MIVTRTFDNILERAALPALAQLGKMVGQIDISSLDVVSEGLRIHRGHVCDFSNATAMPEKAARGRERPVRKYEVTCR